MDNKDVVFYERVVDLYNALGMPIEQDTEFSIHNLLEIHGEIPYKSPVFRANYYSFIFVKNGKGNYTTDEQTFEYSPGTIYFTNPGHLKAFEFYELKEAYLITLSEEFLKTNVHPNIFDEFPFLLAEIVAPQTLSKVEFEEFEQLYLQVLKEYNGDSKYKNQIIGNLFVVLLLKIKQKFWEDYYPLEEGDRNSQIVKQFKKDLEEYYFRSTDLDDNKFYQVQDFARAQHLSASYFNQVIKSKTGKSVGTWIAEKLLTQAKLELKHSSKSVKEISYDLGYSELAHFSNFFKKQTGFSPTQYRKKNKL